MHPIHPNIIDAFSRHAARTHVQSIVAMSNVEYVPWLNILHRGFALCMKLRIQLGLNIQEVRRSRGLSQETLAHLAEIDRGYIGKIENAKHAVTVDMIEAIAQALDTEPMELLRTRPK